MQDGFKVAEKNFGKDKKLSKRLVCLVHAGNGKCFRILGT